MKFRNLFVNSSTGALARIERVDESFATLTILAPSQSKYMMPIKEYDTRFVMFWRQAQIEDLDVLNDTSEFRLPINAPAEWESE